MPAESYGNARSRVDRQETGPDGRTFCDLRIPLGHPASRRTDEDGNAFEVEWAITYVGGPGSQELRWLDPETGVEQPVGEDLLPVPDDDAVRISGDNLASYLRKASRTFDRSVKVTEQHEATGDGPPVGTLPASEGTDREETSR